MKEKLCYLPFFIALLVFLINQLPFLTDMRPVMYDEAWYGDTAYSLLQGNGFSNAIVGKGGNANFLLPVLTSGFMTLFGYSLLAIRLTAVFCGMVTLLFMFFSLRQWHQDTKSMALVLLFFISVPFFNTVFRFGRPECAALMCVACGLWFFFRYQSNASWQNMLGMSVLALAAGCSHPFALFIFALIGVALLWQAINERNAKVIGHLIMLVASAMICVFLIILVSKLYSVGGGSEGVFARFSPHDAMKAIPVYFKEAFLSKAVLYVVPLLAVLVYEACFDKENRLLAIVALVHFVLFPVLFSTDLMMVGLGLDYVVLIATLLLGPCLGHLMRKRKRWLLVAFSLYCLGCLGISYYYNYVVKYEKANSVLAEELPSIIPEGSKVFGPIRQWPMLMQTDYQSDHSVFPIKDVEDYDYVILNSQDTAFYSTYDAFLPIDESRMELVYEKPTRQYGTVQVYKAK